jgi:hypothetical protein
MAFAVVVPSALLQHCHCLVAQRSATIDASLTDLVVIISSSALSVCSIIRSRSISALSKRLPTELIVRQRRRLNLPTPNRFWTRSSEAFYMAQTGDECPDCCPDGSFKELPV